MSTDIYKRFHTNAYKFFDTNIKSNENNENPSVVRARNGEMLGS